MPKPRSCVMVAIDGNSVVAGAREVKNRLSTELGRCGLAGEIQVIETGSFGPANAAVVVAVQPDGIVYGRVTVADVAEIVAEHFVKGRPCRRLVLPGEVPLPAPGKDGSRQNRYQGRTVLDNCGRINPESITEYIANDGYFALGKALTQMKPADVIAEVKKAGLRGRGGAGFPTALKWNLCAPVQADQKFVVCNADEGDPAALKDRLIMEGDPHKVIEGMVLCGYAIGATKGFIYIRGEHRLSIERLHKAINAAIEYGFLGQDIFGSGFAFDIEVKIGAGAYVCGEETALFESMEGKRGLPRLQPPFPAASGYLGKPTNVNNVETLANVPSIIRNGATWFLGVGTAGTPGTRVYTILGHVNRPGLIEVRTGVTLREIINDYGGGMKDGEFKMAQIGGTAGDILGAEMLDVPLDYDAMEKVGHVLGSGAILVMNPSVGVCDFLWTCLRFFVRESCGNCNPCRNGLTMLLDTMARLKAGKGYPGDIAILEEVSLGLKSAAVCPLGQSPAQPIMSALRYFRAEVEAAIDTASARPDPEHTSKQLLEFVN